MSKGKTYKFFGSQFKASTAFAAGQNITSITNASPAVIGVTAHGILTHGVVKVAGVVGMPEINGRLIVVERITDDTLRAVGVDATNFGVYASGGTIAKATMTAHCEQTTYTHDSGATPVTEDETNCGVVTNIGAPRLGSVSLGFKSAENAFQDALEAARLSGDEVAFLVDVDGRAKVIYDVGYVTQLTDGGSAGGTWDGTAAVTLTQHRVKVAR